MKPFNLEEAKAGKPVQTRDGRDVEILKFDFRDTKPILAIVKNTAYDNDFVLTYSTLGIVYTAEGYKDSTDLFMKSETKEGWVAVLTGEKLAFNIYATKEEAESIGGTYPTFVAVAKIEWEE